MDRAYVAPNCICCGSAITDRGTKRGGLRYCGTCHSYADKHKRAVNRIAQAAVRSGDIPPLSGQVCADCGKPATCYDHRDYGKPLEVEPVCFGCNKARPAPVIPAEWAHAAAVHSLVANSEWRLRWLWRDIYAKASA